MSARIVPALLACSLVLLAFDLSAGERLALSDTVSPVGVALNEDRTDKDGIGEGPRTGSEGPNGSANNLTDRVEPTIPKRVPDRNGAVPPSQPQVQARVIAGGGGRASSASFTSVASIGQSTTGISESASFRQHVGYPSVRPTSSVPVATGCISFENLAAGSVFMVGDVFRSAGFDLEVGDFVLSDGSTITTGDLTVGTSPPDFLPKPGKEAFTANATLQAAFDSTQPGLTVLYRDFGGTVNLGVNGSRREAPRMDSLDGVTIGGASVSVRTLASSGSFTAGFVTLEGPVDAVAIGGQEFALDDICVGCITFEDLAVGSSFSQGATVATSGFDVALEEFTLGNGDPAPGDGTLTIVNDSLVGFHTGNKAWTDNVVLAPQLPAPTVDSVQFKYNTAGGSLNLRVNGALANGITDFMALDGQTLGGAQIAVDSLPPSGPGSVAAGVVTISGSVEDLAVGGQELWIDDLCVPNRGGGDDGENGPPTAVIDSFATPKDQTLLVGAPGVLGNDSDADGDPLTASLVAGVSNGALTLNGDGSFEYDPDPGFVGTDAFFYAATDLGGRTDTAQATITVGGDGECPLTWALDVTGTDIAGNTRELTLGQGPEATAGPDPACGEAELPPKPPNDLFDVRFTGSTLPGVTLGNGTDTDIRPDNVPTPDAAQVAASTWRIELQTSDFPLTLAWDASSLADTLTGRIELVDAVTGGDLIQVDMKERGSATIENASIAAVEVRLNREITRTVPTVEGWALVSIPLDAPGQTFSTLLPSCQAGFFYEPGEGYTSIGGNAPVPPGRGFFANCSGGPSSVTGQPPDTSSVSVEGGWNALGALSDPVPVSTITTQPAGIVRTPFYGFDLSVGYEIADTLRPGRAYWVEVSEGGTLDLSGSGQGAALASISLAGAQDFEDREAEEARLVLTDAAGREAALRFAEDLSEKQLRRHVLPPKPPGEVFDVRFEGGQKVVESGENADVMHQIETQGLTYPVTLRLEGTSKEQSLRLKRGVGPGVRETRLTPEKPTARLSSVTRLQAGLTTLPGTFVLEKSYPNPTSGRTTIEYALPKSKQVTVEVYDVLGRRVAQLVNEQKAAGNHSVQLEASRLPSGTYFYRMRAGTFTKTRRLTVVR